MGGRAPSSSWTWKVVRACGAQEACGQRQGGAAAGGGRTRRGRSGGMGPSTWRTIRTPAAAARGATRRRTRARRRTRRKAQECRGAPVAGQHGGCGCGGSPVAGQHGGGVPGMVTRQLTRQRSARCSLRVVTSWEGSQTSLLAMRPTGLGWRGQNPADATDVHGPCQKDVKDHRNTPSSKSLSSCLTLQCPVMVSIARQMSATCHEGRPATRRHGVQLQVRHLRTTHSPGTQP